SWRNVAEVPKRHSSGEPVSLKFIDQMNGAIEMLYNDGLSALKTKDGGLTWTESRTASLYELEKRKQTIDPSSQEVVQARDGSQWRLSEKADRVQVLRRTLPNEDWKELCAIPMSYGYSKGQVLVRQNKR